MIIEVTDSSIDFEERVEQLEEKHEGYTFLALVKEILGDNYNSDYKTNRNNITYELLEKYADEHHAEYYVYDDDGWVSTKLRLRDQHHDKDYRDYDDYAMVDDIIYKDYMVEVIYY